MINSIAAHIDPATIVAQIRMERQQHRGSFLLLEGSSDIKRIEKFTDQTACSLVNCFGKSNVLGAIELMEAVGLTDALGMVDADFDRIRRIEADVDAVVISESHDFDMDHAGTPIFDRYLSEVADESKVAAVGGVTACATKIIKALKPLSVLRYANEIRKLRYNLKDVQIEDFFDGDEIDIQKMIDSVSFGRFQSNEHKLTLTAILDELMSLEFDLLQITNGHDFFAGLGIALRSQLGSRKWAQTWRSEIELHFRLGLSYEDFSTIAAYNAIREWEANSNGLSVLRK